MRKTAIKKRPKSKRKSAKLARKRIKKLFAKKKRKVIKKREIVPVPWNKRKWIIDPKNDRYLEKMKIFDPDGDFGAHDVKVPPAQDPFKSPSPGYHPHSGNGTAMDSDPWLENLRKECPNAALFFKGIDGEEPSYLHFGTIGEYDEWLQSEEGREWSRMHASNYYCK